MPRTVYYTATTLDGFIADADNSLQWLFDVPRADPDDSDAAGSWEEFIGAVGALVLGSTTYEWVVEHENLEQFPQRWKEFYDERPSWVLSGRDLPALPGVDIRFARGDRSPLGSGAPLLPRRIEGMHLVDVRREGEMVRLAYDVRR